MSNGNLKKFIYYYFKSDSRASNWPGQIRQIELRNDSEHWQDIAFRIGQRHSLTKTNAEIAEDYSVRKKHCERQSIIACAVHNVLEISETIPEPSILEERSEKLAPLCDGSLLRSGDVLLLCRVPYEMKLFVDDIMHRFWIISMVCEYFETNSAAARHAKRAFYKAKQKYRLKEFALRQMVIARYTKKLKKEPQAKERAGDVLKLYQALLVEYGDKGIQKHQNVFDFNQMYSKPMCRKTFQRINNRLKNLPIDVNYKTAFLQHLIRRCGGMSESEVQLAVRIDASDDKILFMLVRAVQHCHESAYLSEIEQKVQETIDCRSDNDAEPNDDNKRKHTENENSKEAETKRRKLEHENEQIRIKQITDKAAEQYAVKSKKTSQIYCTTCDIPGHHTRNCPRKKFITRLCSHIEADVEHFYSKDCGIFTSMRSRLAQAGEKKKIEVHGVLARDKARMQRIFDLANNSLPKVPKFDLRWVADR